MDHANHPMPGPCRSGDFPTASGSALVVTAVLSVKTSLDPVDPFGLV